MAEKDKNQHDNADQEQHQGEDANKPWETLFDDDRDDQGNLSRVATRKKRQGSSKLTWILAILLILAVLAPIIYYKVMDNQGSSGGNLSNDKVVIQSAKRPVIHPRPRNPPSLPKRLRLLRLLQRKPQVANRQHLRKRAQRLVKHPAPPKTRSRQARQQHQVRPVRLATPIRSSQATIFIGLRLTTT